MHRRFMTMDAEKKGYITVQQFSLLPELCCNPLCELITASFDANKVALSRSALCSRVTCSLGQQDRLHGIPHLPRRLSPDHRRHRQAAGAPRFSAIPTLAHGKHRDALALALANFGLMRVQFCFRMFDSQKNGSISIEEARALFFQLPPHHCHSARTLLIPPSFVQVASLLGTFAHAGMDATLHPIAQVPRASLSCCVPLVC